MGLVRRGRHPKLGVWKRLSLRPGATTSRLERLMGVYSIADLGLFIDSTVKGSPRSFFP